MAKEETKNKSSNHIQSVERAITLIDVIASKQDGLTLSQIAQKVGWPKSTVHGLLTTLRDYNYIEQSNEDGRYRLGIRLFELGSRVARSFDIKDVAVPVMKRLNKRFGETVHLGAEDNGEILYLEKVAADSLVSIMSEVGIRLPMHCSGLGKVLLAQKSEAELKRLISQKGLPALTKRTITTKTKLDEELEKVRKQGYALDDGEIMEGLRCVAAPVNDANGKTRYAISVSGQVRDLYGKRLEQIIKETIQAANEISKAMLQK
ncbi:MAG: IclR family transcriptional regulator [Solobacterium sp.]|nr:IclR family transcriptional regulator [Solobacterium sp.]